jgi:hypothetical protein
VRERFQRDPTIQVGGLFSALAGIELSSLRSSRERTVAMLPVRLFGFHSDFRFPVSAFSPGVTEPTLALRCRAKPRHASARARD